MSGAKVTYPKFHVMVSVKAYAKKAGEGAVNALMGAFQFTLNLVVLISLPLWYPILFFVFRLRYPAFLRAQARERKETMDRMFPDKEEP
jgi:hypothetical protein